MNRLVERIDIVDYASYEDIRSEIRPAMLAAKRLRRVDLNANLTLLFENSTTLQYQIQEIMRAEHIVREAEIVHEIETYNSILGSEGDLGCVLLIAVEEAKDRKRLLVEWLGLQARLYVTLADGTKTYAEFDASQVGTDRLSAVQYLRFPVTGRVPVGLGTDFEGLESEVDLTTDQVHALTEDLART